MLFSAAFDGDRLEVDLLMAVLAQGDSVLHNEAKLGEAGIVLQVVGLKVAAAIVATVLAGVVVPGKHRFAPDTVGGRAPVEPVSLVLAVGIGVVILATLGAQLGLSGNFCPCFWSMFGANAVSVEKNKSSRLVLLGRTHCCFGFSRMLASFERRRPSLGWLPTFDPTTGMTPGRLAIVPGAVRVKLADREPKFALRTMLQSGAD
jgi:hypothetical protein